jgi:putative oxidoreductase
MRRLFWTFPDGLPGAGLLLMRLATAGASLYWGAIEWPGRFAWSAIEGLGALFLLAGLGTPVAGALLAFCEAWHTHSHPEERWAHGLLVVLATSVALMGPGAVSVDARIFGWRRIAVGGSLSSRLERGERPHE